MHSTIVHAASDADATRTAIAQHAERLASYAGMLAELIAMREDDRAYSLLGGVLDQVLILKRDFADLGRLRLEESAIRAGDELAA